MIGCSSVEDPLSLAPVSCTECLYCFHFLAGWEVEAVQVLYVFHIVQVREAGVVGVVCVNPAGVEEGGVRGGVRGPKGCFGGP